MKRILTTVFFATVYHITEAQLPSTGLVASWSMNGNFTDAGPSNISVTNNGPVTATTNNVGAANAAMFFNNVINVTSASPAATQYATFTSPAPLNFNATASFTIGMVFKINSIPNVNQGGVGLIDNNSNYGGYSLFAWRTTAAGNPIQLVFNFKGGQVKTNTTSVTINLNTWYHITMMYNGSVASLYLNGSLVATTGNVGSTTPVYTFPARFGTLFFNGGFGTTPPNYNPINGSIDEVLIYNRTLTTTEIGAVASISLPVKLNNFSAALQNEKTLLNWQTTQEQNSKHFIIERSTDGQNFDAIQTIAAAGSSSVVKNYNYTDNLSNALLQYKKIYYRIKMVDLDGIYSYSIIIPLHLKVKDISILLSPIPVKNIMQIQTNNLGKGLTIFSIINGNGKVVQQKVESLHTTIQTITLQIGVLPVGSYVLRVTNESNQLSKKFIKQ